MKKRQAADRLISHLDDETIAKAQAAFAKTDSVGQHRMASLHNGKRENLEISPNLWAGVGLVRGGAGTALVGDGPTVAARINEYADRASTALFSPAIRTSKRPTGWASCYSRIWTSPFRKFRSRSGSSCKAKPWQTSLFRAKPHRAKE